MTSAPSLALSNADSLVHALPEASLVIGALLILIWDLIAPKGRNPGARLGGTFAIALIALASSGTFAVLPIVAHAPALILFGGQIARDGYAGIFRLVFAVIGAMVLITAIPTREVRRSPREGGSGSELVEVAPPGDNLWLDFAGAPIDHGGKVVGMSRRVAQQK